MLAAIACVREDITGISFDEFASDQRRLRSVAFCLVVLGEAAASLSHDIQSMAPDVPWALLRGMRNRIIHEYFHVDAEFVRDTAADDLPALEAPLRKLHEALERS
jgi:uncharacterized protein with HEPN domain